MSYTVLARRYRSRDFDEIVGQESISRTLKNAIANQRAAHAYLFCGTRGVGKTSMARIFARALNVSDELAESELITEAIFRGDDLDVIEIDAASNRGIDNARDLIAGAGLSPARCQYKIYIIDEVHMLTREAFNALLKTMEEPPAHVKFILCTTEAHKVPATIQSRCQRFDFRPLATPQIAKQLRMILDTEKLQADDEVINQIARLGNGSMRDALSLMDRLLAAGENVLTAELLEQMLGLPDQTLIMNLVDAIISEDSKSALEATSTLLNTGVPVELLLEMLAGHFRNLMVIAACGKDTALLELSTEAQQIATTQAGHFDVQALVHMIALCDAASRNAKGSSITRVLIDAVVVRLCMSSKLADVATLLATDQQHGPPATTSPRTTVKKKELPSVAAVAPDPVVDPVSDPGARLTEVKLVTSAAVVSNDDVWPAVVKYASTRPPVQAKVQLLEFKSCDDQTLFLQVSTAGDWLINQAASLETLVKSATERNMRVQIELSGEEQPVLSPASETAGQEAAQLPIVRQAMELFEARIVSVEDVDSAPSHSSPNE